MNVGTGISVEEYLRTSYDNPDREFRDGELEERSLPDYIHGKTQGLLFAFFLALQSRLPVFPSVETRLRIRKNLILIPDVTVFHPIEPTAGVPEVPPLVAIEVMSVDDRLTQIHSKLNEYREWGVKYAWLVDPRQRRMYACDGALTEVPSLRIPELDIEILPVNILK
jgi:Uma2 family endonuclease